MTFQLVAQSQPFARLAAVYRGFDFDGPLGLVKAAVRMSDRITGETR
jgi:4-hydroxyphenylacetate 3-monooxygenase